MSKRKVHLKLCTWLRIELLDTIYSDQLNITAHDSARVNTYCGVHYNYGTMLVYGHIKGACHCKEKGWVLITSGASISVPIPCMWFSKNVNTNAALKE